MLASTSDPAHGTARGVSWAARREGGSAVLLRALLFLSLRCGHAAGSILLLPVTAWFLLSAGQARAASRDYLRRVLNRPARLVDVARHFHSFASAVLDRVFLLAGRSERFRITTEGLDVVEALVAEGRGCMLLGAHLGSFEVLRSLQSGSPVPVRPLMFRRNAGALTALLDRLAPDLRRSIIEIGEPSSMLQVGESIARGEIVGILADRTPDAAGSPHKRVAVPFLGAAAAFPAGPFILAHTVGAPVLLFHAVRTGPRRYHVRFQPFADPVLLRRAHRAADLQLWVSRYATVLEGWCRAHPYNWFNFFPFWADAVETPPDADTHPR